MEAKQLFILMNSDNENRVAQHGSDSDMDDKVTIRCSSVGGDDIGVCRVYRNATIGQLIAKLMEVSELDLQWFQVRKFEIAKEVYSFDDPYKKFMKTLPIRNALESTPGQELHCCIVRCEEQPALDSSSD